MWLVDGWKHQKNWEKQPQNTDLLSSQVKIGPRSLIRTRKYITRNYSGLTQNCLWVKILFSPPKLSRVGRILSSLWFFGIERKVMIVVDWNETFRLEPFSSKLHYQQILKYYFWGSLFQVAGQSSPSKTSDPWAICFDSHLTHTQY